MGSKLKPTQMDTTDLIKKGKNMAKPFFKQKKCINLILMPVDNIYFRCPFVHFSGNGLNTSNANSDLVRKPTRLEALPNVGDVNRKSSTRKKSSGPILNTMGTF